MLLCPPCHVQIIKAAAPAVLMIFGSLCESNGVYCGEGGQRGGGVMLAVGCVAGIAMVIYTMMYT